MALDCSDCLFKYHNGSELGLCGYLDPYKPIKDMTRCPQTFYKCYGCDYLGSENDRAICLCFDTPYLRYEYLDEMEKCPLDEPKGEKMNVVEKIGEAALLEQAAEECVELAKELLKMARKIRNENPTPTQKDEIFDNIQEETADILLCIDHLEKAGYIVQDEVMGIYRHKEERMKKRLGGE